MQFCILWSPPRAEHTGDNSSIYKLIDDNLVADLNVNYGCFGWSKEPGDYLWPIVRDLVLLSGLMIMAAMDH